MAIVVKNAMSGLGAIKKIGIHQSLYDKLHASDIHIKLSASSFDFIVAGEVVTQTLVTLDTLQRLNEGTLSLTAKMLLSNKLMEAVQTALDHQASLSGDVAPQSTLAKLPPLASNAAKPAPVAPGWPEFPQSKLFSEPVVMLRDASQMYQPVKGTSGGSRYFMVAAGDGIRVAARYSGNTLSIRIEGAKLAKYAAQISDAGIDVKTAAEYASVHLEVPSHLLATKTLGAVLLGLSLPLQTPFPNLQMIKE